MKEIILCLLIVFTCSCATTKENIQKANAHYQLGLSYFNENKIQLAYVEFQKALEFNPDDKEVLHALGIVYLEFNDHQKAKDSFLKALTIDPNFPEAHYNLGATYGRMGKWSDAVNSFNIAINNPLYRKHDIAYNSLGEAYYRLGLIDDAIEAYNEAIMRGINFYRPYYGLALSYNAKGRYGDAASAMQQAIEIDPFFKGDKDKAIKYFNDRKLKAQDEEAKDVADYLEILKY